MLLSPHISRSALKAAFAAQTMPTAMAQSYQYKPAQTGLTGALSDSETSHQQTNMLVTAERK